MAGLLGAALGGAGGAIQDNAKAEIQKRKQAALIDLRNRYAMQRQDDQQQFQTSEREAQQNYATQERIAGQDFTAGQNAADRQQRAALAAQQQAGAQSRTNAGGWTVVPKQGGGYQRFNTITGETGDVPDGVNPSGGEITKRQELLFKQAGDQIKQIDKRLNDSSAMLNDQQRAELKAQRSQLLSQQQQILGAGNAETSIPGLGEFVSSRVGTTKTTEDSQAPDEQPGNFRSAVDRTQQNRQAQQQKQQAEKQADAIDNQIDTIASQVQGVFGRSGGLLGMNTQSVGMSDADKQQKGRELLNQMRTLYNDPNTSEFQRRRIAQQLDTLANAGISIEDF